MNRYEEAKQMYASCGVDTEAALTALANVPLSLHCWQGDDVTGFDHEGALSGGIQTTGNYPGKARTPKELMADFEKAASLIPGKLKLNLHACYAIFADGEYADRDRLLPKHFKAWVDFAKAHNMGIDFNPTYFSHPMVKDNLTLTSPDETVRKFWVEHGKCCAKIAEYFAEETGVPCVMNIWIPDGLKDVPADRLGPRARYMQSVDEILSVPYDKEKVLVTLESKVFGIGLESYTAGSAEFALSYATTRGIVPLMDNGHYHPTEVVSDKISALLCFNPRIALHITRGVRWDSDHVVRYDDETVEMMKEVVRNNALDRVILATDYFDASINRIAAWVIGMRSVQKALLTALLLPNEKLRAMQDNRDFTELMMLQEELKFYPIGDVWAEFCRRAGIDGSESWFSSVKTYETEVLSKRG